MRRQRTVQIVTGPKAGQKATVLRDQGATLAVEFEDGSRGFISKFHVRPA